MSFLVNFTRKLYCHTNSYRYGVVFVSITILIVGRNLVQHVYDLYMSSRTIQSSKISYFLSGKENLLENILC